MDFQHGLLYGNALQTSPLGNGPEGLVAADHVAGAGGGIGSRVGVETAPGHGTGSQPGLARAHPGAGILGFTPGFFFPGASRGALDSRHCFSRGDHRGPCIEGGRVYQYRVIA